MAQPTPRHAQQAGPDHDAAAAALDRSCATRKDVLNVSRVVEIDTTGGPRFGGEALKSDSFLEPGEIVLTFDDGPLRYNTRRVLAALDAECTKATFFSVGKMALADPSMLREVERRGHTVGSHTWSHRNLKPMPAALARQEMELGISAVSAALGHPAAPFFRFPYLSVSHAMVMNAQARNIAIFNIDVDAVDYRTHDPAVVQKHVLAGLKAAGGRGIILFHDIQISTAGALRGLLAELRAEGYHVVHMVPKEPVVTLPEFDAVADRELARHKVAAAANPLATRAVVWPNSGDGGLEPIPSSQAGPGEGGHAVPKAGESRGFNPGAVTPRKAASSGDAYVQRRAQASGLDTGPQGVTATGTTAPRAPAPAPATNWLTSIFGN